MESRWFRHTPSHWDRFATLTAHAPWMLEFITGLLHQSQHTPHPLLIDTAAGGARMDTWRP
jgi:hypothetical protein